MRPEWVALKCRHGTMGGWIGFRSEWVMLWPGSCADLGLGGPGSRLNLGLAQWCDDPVMAWSGWIELWVLLCFKEFLGALKCWFEVLVFSGVLNCWCFISLKTALINRVSKTRFPCGRRV